MGPVLHLAGIKSQRLLCTLLGIGEMTGRHSEDAVLGYVNVFNGRRKCYQNVMLVLSIDRAYNCKTRGQSKVALDIP